MGRGERDLANPKLLELGKSTSVVSDFLQILNKQKSTFPPPVIFQGEHWPKIACKKIGTDIWIT